MTIVKNPQANALVERLHQVILNMLVIKDLDNKISDHVDTWGETLAPIAWVIIDSYRHTTMVTAVQALFFRDIMFNLASAVDWRVVTTAKQRQVDIYNVRENARRVTHDYAIGDQVYVEMIGVYQILDYKKQGPYRIT